jgi:hypothetical protein
LARGEEQPRSRRRRTAASPEERLNNLINLSYDAAEEQIKEGRATSQLLTHFLKLGTEREQLELERIRNENKLLDAKVEALASAARMEELYAEALKAMSSYQGRPEPDLVLPDD